MGIFDVESRSEGENLPSVSRSEKSSRYHFQVNLGGMLDILSNHLYKSPDVFIRELLQNGVDAITMRQKRQLGWEGGILSITVEPGRRIERSEEHTSELQSQR